MDDEGREVMVFREIIDHEVNDEAETSDQPGTKTTRGWQIQVEMADDSTHWLPLRDVKEANPVEMAKYAIANGIYQELAFKWWVPYVLRKREWIISKVEAKYWRTT